jgi:hypothetical protein
MWFCVVVAIGAIRLLCEESPASFLAVIESNWKAVLLCLLPLFFVPIRSLMDRLRRAPGWEWEAQHGQPSPPSPLPPGAATTQSLPEQPTLPGVGDGG